MRDLPPSVLAVVTAVCLTVLAALGRVDPAIAVTVLTGTGLAGGAGWGAARARR